jgi:hypothetical protein
MNLYTFSIPIVPVQGIGKFGPASGVKFSVQQIEVIPHIGAYAKCKILSSGNYLLGSFNSSVTGAAYEDWTGDDNYIIKQFAINAGYSPIN